MSVCVSSSMPTPLMVDESLSCPQCPKSFPSMKLLQQHQQMFHTDKAFICETCGKAFRFRSNLAEHRSVHTALKPYVCKFCGKSSRLKGNLTKHILKHHKKEHNEAIGKDDIIVKKDRPDSNNGNNNVSINNNNSVKVETDESKSSLFTITSTSTNGERKSSFTVKEEPSDQEKSILVSLGLDYTASLDLRDTPETSVSPDNTAQRMDLDSELYFDNSLAPNTSINDSSLAALIAQVSGESVSETPTKSNVSSSTNGTNGTQCPECGKHVRKSSYLPVHMTLHHGYPPPESGASNDDKTNDESADDSIHSELRAIANAICDLRSQQLGIPKIEQLLCGIDARVNRLEKNMDMALNSIYTLVQLQTGMNSSVNRFKDDASGKLHDIKLILERATNSD